jgi:hypothetical protein
MLVRADLERADRGFAQAPQNIIAYGIARRTRLEQRGVAAFPHLL